MDADKLRWSLKIDEAELDYSGEVYLGRIMLRGTLERIRHLAADDPARSGTFVFEGYVGREMLAMLEDLKLEVHEIRDGRDILLSTARASH